MMQSSLWKALDSLISRRRLPEGPRGLDRAVSEISLLDDVVSTETHADGSLTIWVREDVASTYDTIVRLIRRHAPGTHGEVRRVSDGARLTQATRAPVLWS